MAEPSDIPLFPFPFYNLVILVLLLVIAILVIQLRKKDRLLWSIMEKLHIKDPKTGKDELFSILSRLQKVEFTRLLSRDKFLDQSVLDFIFEDHENRKIYLHYTREQEVADQILQQGFHFRYSFYKTADRIINDKLDLIYKHSRNKPYGAFVIVIAIGKDIFWKYSEALKSLRKSDVVLEQLLTEMPPFIDEDSDPVYTLVPRFVKGHINYETGVVVKNPEFDPNYDSPAFKQNLENLQ
jgi:hypothetical protein